jgi:hypothetical protein
MVKKFPALWTPTSITAFTGACHVSVSCARSRLRHCEMLHNILSFYGEELLAPCPTPKLKEHPFSAVCDCLFNIFISSLHIWKLVFHLQPYNTPCCGDRNPLIMDLSGKKKTHKVFSGLNKHHIFMMHPTQKANF